MIVEALRPLPKRLPMWLVLTIFCRDIDEQLAHSRSVMNTAHFHSSRLSLDKWREIEKKVTLFEFL